MITQDAFPVEPWRVRETRLDLGLLGSAESVFALSNGHIGFRGNLDEGEPHGLPGTYLNSFCEDRPLPYAEAGYGYPEVGQSIVNVTDGKLVRLFVDDEPFDVRYGDLVAHERVLDLQAGTLVRTAQWTSPAGKRIRVRSTRLVSFVQRAVAAVEYVVEALDGVRVTVQSELVANEAMPSAAADPRVAAALRDPLEPVEHDSGRAGATLVHRTRSSRLQMAAGMENHVQAPGRVEVETHDAPDWARTTVVSVLEAGQELRLTKFLAYGWSAQRSVPALRDQVAGALSGARFTGFEGLLTEQREYLEEFWDAADVLVEGDPEVQQAVRFALFHVLQAGARAEQRGIAAKGLTGPGYDGHVFWDTEAYVLPVLTYTAPQAAADALRWRARTIGAAQRRAQELGLTGAAFPWRTIRGQESSGYWPAGTAAFHVNADIAAAVERYRIATGSTDLETDGGLLVLVQTARLWMSLGHHDAQGRWHVAGVTGPDEYTAVVADNTFTNLAAAQNLLAAVGACQRHPDLARALEVDPAEQTRWREAAENVHVPYDEDLRVHQQCEGFTTRPEWDFAANPHYPLLLHSPYFDLYRKQVVKQADLMMALFWFPDRFSAQDKARAVDYYERRTVRDSSLSAAVQAITAAEVGHLQLAHDYVYEAATVDLRDLHHNTGDGLHMASLAGTWLALVHGLGGMRDAGGTLRFDPHLPDGLSRLRFTVRWREAKLCVDVTHDEVTYTVRDHGTSVELRHGGETLVVRSGEPLTRSLTPVEPLLPRPEQPPGRAPVHRQA